MDHPVNSSSPVLASDLPVEQELERLNRIIAVLMRRTEQNMESQGSDYGLFQSAVTLERRINERTEQLNEALEQLGQINRDLQRSQEEHQAATHRLSDAVESISEGFALFDCEDRLVVCNQKFLDIWELKKEKPESLHGVTFTALMQRVAPHVIDREGLDHWLRGTLHRHREATGSYEQRFQRGHYVQIRERKTHDGYTVALYADVTELKHREEARRQRELAEKSVLLQSSLNSIQQGIAVFSGDEELLAWNHKFLDLMEIPEAFVRIRITLGELRHRIPRFMNLNATQKAALFDSRQVILFESQFSNNKIIQIQCSPMQAGGFVATFTDISQQKQAERRIRYIATHDNLTHVANRTLFNEKFLRLLNDRHALGGELALIYLDLNNFKDVNDTLGHQVGDKLLRDVAHRISQIYPREGIFARLGGDEFAIVMPQHEDREELIHFMELLIATLGRPFQVDANEIHTSASIGITLYPQDGGDVDALLRNADIAMYQAKQSPGHISSYCFYQEEMTNWLQERNIIEHGLRQALENNEMYLEYQPRYSFKSQRVVAMEALLRWNHPVRGLISPAVFIPIAEHTGLISQIGNWVIETACRQAKDWIQRNRQSMVVSVNLSPAQFHFGDPVKTLKEMLKKTGLPAKCLEIEITENTLMESADFSIEALTELKKLGVRVAIDDFGTGYSSLNYLKRFPVDVLKVDQSFVANIGVERSDEAIVNTVISLGKVLNLEVVAEGVETEQQCGFIEQAGCDQLQGNYYSRPLTSHQFEQFLWRSHGDRLKSHNS